METPLLPDGSLDMTGINAAADALYKAGSVRMEKKVLITPPPGRITDTSQPVRPQSYQDPYFTPSLSAAQYGDKITDAAGNFLPGYDIKTMPAEYATGVKDYMAAKKAYNLASAGHRPEIVSATSSRINNQFTSDNKAHQQTIDDRLAHDAANPNSGNSWIDNFLFDAIPLAIGYMAGGEVGASAASAFANYSDGNGAPPTMASPKPQAPLNQPVLPDLTPESLAMLGRKRGRQSTLLTGPLGESLGGAIDRKTLVGM